MALLWFEGFEAVNNNLVGIDRLYETTGGILLSAKDGASATAQEAAAQDNGFLRTGSLVAVDQNSWIIGFAFQPDDFTHIEDSDAAHVAIHNDDGEQCRVEFADWTPTSTKPQGNYYKIRFMRGTTELASTDQHFEVRSESVNDGGWIFMEFKITISDTVGSVEGRYHYITKPSLNPSGAYTAFTWDAATTSLDTQEQTSTGGNRLEVSWDTGNSNEEVVFDDIYACDSTGAKNNDYLGKIAVIPQKPRDFGSPPGDGDTVDWVLAGGATDTHHALDEATSTIQDDIRLTSEVLDDVHLHIVDTIEPTTANHLKIPDTATIIGVRHDLHCKMETTGDLDLIHYLRKTTATAAETEVGTAFNVNSTTMIAHSVVLEDDPNTATDWVHADMDSYQYGIKNKG